MAERDRWEATAARYHVLAPRLTVYRETNRRLVEWAGLAPGLRVVDLACGTGLTSAAIWAAEPRLAALYAVDFSPAMLRSARRRLADLPVRWVEADAADFARHLAEPVDRILTNSAFWLFPSAALAEGYRALVPGGSWVCNIPDQDFDFGDGKGSALRELVNRAVRRLPALGAAAVHDVPPQWSLQVVRERAEGCGFQVERHGVQAIRLTPQDILDFYRLPKFCRGRLPPGMPYRLGARLLRQALRAAVPAQGVEWRWALFRLVRPR